MTTTKRGAAGLALMTVVGLFALKVVVAAVTGSVSIMAQMADSFLDVLAVGLTFMAVVVADRPADDSHPFGHGKLENFSALVQAIFIFGAAAVLIYSSVQKIIHGTSLEYTGAGIAVMAVSIISSWLLTRYLRRAALETDSSALDAIMHNINADIYSAAGVLVGLTVILVSGGRLAVVDPIVAIMVSLIILSSGLRVLRDSVGELMDASLPPAEAKVIEDTIRSYNNQLVGFHKLRTRKSGSTRHVDLHLVLPEHATVESAHELCTRLEEELKARLPNLSVIIHMEPCEKNCQDCELSCTERKS